MSQRIRSDAYEIQHFTLAEGWINISTDDCGRPLVFATRAEAARELRRYLADALEACAEGDLLEFDPDQYRIARRGGG